MKDNSPSDKADPAMAVEGDFRAVTFDPSLQGESLMGTAVRDGLPVSGPSDHVPLGEETAGILIGGTHEVAMSAIYDGAVIDGLALVGGPAVTDLIADFGDHAGDVIDLASLIEGPSVAPAGPDGAFGRSDLETTDVTLHADGGVEGNASNFVTVEYLNVDAGVKILYDEDLAAVTAPHAS